MKNKIFIKALVVSSFLLSGSAMADVTSGTANFNLVAPIATTAGAAMDFGDIDTSTTGNCGIDSAGVETGTLCLATGNASSRGAFVVTGNDGLVNLSVGNVTGAITGITFTPAVVATDTIGSGSLNVNVYGDVVLGAGVVATGAQSLTYDLTVTY
ncbi:MAG: hypothetical protein JKY55_14365 [Aliivibrio sp.]|uniref:hypothetical protein n=1 Tax=Aliivibrio sp. TaxID=1872443 RepID=UPI001A53205B|nr:hypothetical protein [Aliivibrio sp.]